MSCCDWDIIAREDKFEDGTQHVVFTIKPTAALEELLLRVSAMVEDLPEIVEMDLNPVKVLSPGQGCMVVDTRILLQVP